MGEQVTFERMREEKEEGEKGVRGSTRREGMRRDRDVLPRAAHLLLHKTSRYPPPSTQNVVLFFS
jgi:hypothetical protein